MLVKVEGRPDLVKDVESGAVLTVDKKASDAYLRQKALINNNKKMQLEFNDLKQKIDDLESVKQDVQEIKALLKELVTK